MRATLLAATVAAGLTSASAAQTPPRPAETTQAADSPWTVTRLFHAVTGEPAVTLTTTADSPYVGGGGRSYLATLVLRCRSGNTAFYFHAEGDRLSAGPLPVEGTLTVDDHPPLVVALTGTPADDALGPWRSAGSVPVIQAMLGGTRLTIGVTPVDDDPKSIAFAIAKLDRDVAPLREACGW